MSDGHPKITIIGCGGPTPLPDSYGSAYVVAIGGEKLLFDCGPATTYKLVRAGIAPTEIDHVFFTHHHFDHDADFPAFVLTRWDHLVPSDKPLYVYGPQHTEALVRGILNEETGLWTPDLNARTRRAGSQWKYQQMGGHLPRRRPVVEAHDLVPGPIMATDTWQVVAGPVEHAHPELHSLAYRIDSDHGSVVITGDTRPCDSVTRLARGADVLMMMCWDSEERIAGTPMEAVTTSITGAARTAADAGVRQLVMVHIGARLTRSEQDEARRAEARAAWDGPIIWGRELMEVPWPQ